jgi:hypothetical protein
MQVNWIQAEKGSSTACDVGSKFDFETHPRDVVSRRKNKKLQAQEFAQFQES